MNANIFYAALFLKNGKAIAHATSFDLNQLKQAPQENTAPPRPEESKNVETNQTFTRIFDTFESQMRSYRQFLPLTLQFAPLLARTYGETQIGDYIREKGKKLESTIDRELYELDTSFLRLINERHNNFMAAREGARLLPEIIFVGLVSIYDAFIYSIVMTVASTNPSIIVSSEKSLSLNESMKFSSIEELRDHFVEMEVTSALRANHIEQIEWISKRFSLNIDMKIPIWKEFHEICERRNLFVHTGGTVSDTYIKNCQKYGFECDDVIAGKKIKISKKYLERSIAVFQEIGTRLCYIIWRKFIENEVEKADSAYNLLCFNLIRDEEYELAISLLNFSCSVPRVSDVTQRMMVVNQANALKLSGKQEQANILLDKYDWSASAIDYRISVAAVKDDIDELVKLMDFAGPGFEKNNYRDWPVFNNVIGDEKFISKFRKIYNEDVLNGDHNRTKTRLVGAKIEIDSNKDKSG